MSTQDGGAVWLPDWTVHPGEILGEWAAEHSVTAAQLATIADCPLSDIQAFLRGDAPVTGDLADILHFATGMSTALWLGMQKAYDDHVWAGRR